MLTCSQALEAAAKLPSLASSLKLSIAFTLTALNLAVNAKIAPISFMAIVSMSSKLMALVITVSKIFAPLKKILTSLHSPQTTKSISSMKFICSLKARLMLS